MLREGYGGLFLTVKPEDRDTYIGYVRDAGRMDDLIVFSPDHTVYMNFIADEIAASLSTRVLVENISALISTVSQLGERERSHSGDGRFFHDYATIFTQHVLLVLVESGQPVTMPNLHKLIVSAPKSLEQVKSKDWQNSSYLYQCLQAADTAPKSPSLKADFDLALTELLHVWPAMSNRTRTGIEATLTTTTSKLSRGAARDMLSASEPNLSPSALFDGKIIIADFNVATYRDVGILIQVILKYVTQLALARRDVRVHPRPVFIVADEAQTLLVDADQHFQAIARSTRTASIYATQSISSLLDAWGPNSEAKVETLLANLQTLVYGQQTDIRTIEHLQQVIGKTRQFRFSGNNSRSNDWMATLLGSEEGTSTGINEVFEYEIQAGDLSGLVKGGPPHWFVESIIYQNGRTFPNGRTWLKARIPQQVGGHRAP